jgi:hypothetical protein
MLGKRLYEKIIGRNITRLIVVIFLLISIVTFSCSKKIPSYTETDREVKISPDYTAITLPPNIAPLNFTVNEDADKYLIEIYESGGEKIIIKSSEGSINIPERKWKKLLQKCVGSDMFIAVYIKKEGDWIKFSEIVNHVATEPIDSYVVYRLIDPGFELWNKMGIYQRCLENFDERPIMINSISDDNCMNCHSFSKNSSQTMMFHMRSKYAGTIIYRNGKLKKVDTKTDKTISPGVYPAFHPGGRYIAFSVNHIVQSFHSVRQLKVEVTDTLSDIMVYDSEQNIVFSSPAITKKDQFETCPTWSPDGKFLYYCNAKATSLAKFDSIHYDLHRIAFDETNCRFGTVDTVVSVSSEGRSISFPRISPDGMYLMFCQSDFGNFSIWHSESDLYLLNLETGEITEPDINSEQSESYHTWSSGGRWIVFSSRRIDGLFTRLYFSFFDNDGKAHKPFLLPQKDPGFYSTFLKSYNVPELITGSVKLNPRKLNKIIRSEPEKSKYQDFSQ